MAGTLWHTFRQGNRSEYLALYILSALGVVVKVPKEEDIGADFHCTLAHMDGKRMTFHTPFLVQTKSTSENTISYGGIDEKGRWKKEQINWLFSQELPLLIGLVDKKKLTLEFFTTSNMWGAFYGGGNVGEVILLPNIPSGDGVEIDEPTSDIVESLSGIGDGKSWKVPLGPPLVSISIDDLEDIEKIKSITNILSYPLLLEQENITYRRLQVHYSKRPKIINTNRLTEVFTVFAAANTGPGRNTPEQLKALAPIVTTLAFNYKIQSKLSELRQLKTIVSLIPDGPELQLLKIAVPALFD